jgi:hypothetical protein
MEFIAVISLRADCTYKKVTIVKEQSFLLLLTSFHLLIHQMWVMQLGLNNLPVKHTGTNKML